MEANREYLRSGHRATQARQLVAIAITSVHAPHLTNAMCAAEPFGGARNCSASQPFRKSGSNPKKNAERYI